ncbi:hypothetical protein QJQ45_008087 [Haematococcus lacustris]|nr:hypothetical protein QJQ45_008087 [Haematococcus lacustris]
MDQFVVRGINAADAADNLHRELLMHDEKRFQMSLDHQAAMIEKRLPGTTNFGPTPRLNLAASPSTPPALARTSKAHEIGGIMPGWGERLLSANSKGTVATCKLPCCAGSRSAVKELRPQLLVLWVHRADTITATSKMLGINGRWAHTWPGPWVGTVMHAMQDSVYIPLLPTDRDLLSCVVLDCVPAPRGTVLPGAHLAGAEPLPLNAQGALRQFRSKQRQGFTRNYTALWQRLVELKAGASVDSGRPASPAAIKVRVKVLGKGLKRQLGIPEALDADVDHFAQLPYPEFWAHIHRSLALVPAFGMSVYYESRISSTIIASFISSTPLIAEQRLLDTYPFLTPAHVFLREPGEDEAAAMYRVASMPEADIFNRRAAMQQLRLQLNTDSQYVDRLESAALWAWQQIMAASKASACEASRRDAQQLCTLLLTDPEVLGTLLALHDIRAAQLGLCCPPVLYRQGKTAAMSSRWEVPTKHLTRFCKDSVQAGAVDKVEPEQVLAKAWPSLCRITDLLLAVVNSYPLHPQPPSPAPAPVPASQCSSPGQLAPGLACCSASLNLSLRLAAAQALQARQQGPAHQAAMDRLHPVLGPWLRGQCLAQSLLLAAGHPQRDAQRAEAVSCLVPLVQALVIDTQTTSYSGGDVHPLPREGSRCGWRPERWRHKLSSSPMTTNWPAALPATSRQRAKSRAPGASSEGTEQLPDLRVVNSYAHICHALSSLVLQQPQPLERMKLFSTTTPGRGGSCVESCTKCLEVATALLSREEWCVVALSGSMCCPLPDLALTKSTWQFDWMDGLQPLLPPALPVLHRAVTAATGSAVLLRLTLWLTHHQPPQAALAAAVTACARQLSHIARIGTQALPSLSLAQRGGPEGVVLRRLAIQATAAAAHAQITLTQLVYPGLVKGVVPGVAWPLHPVLSLLETVREEWSLMSCIRSSCDNTFLEEAESEWPSKLVAGGHVELLCATEQLIQALEFMCTVWLPNIKSVDDTTSKLVEKWIDLPARLLIRSTQLLQMTAVVGREGLSAQPAAWLPPWHQLIKGWCSRLVTRVCHVAEIVRLLDAPHTGLGMSRNVLKHAPLLQHAPMQPDTEQALDLLVLTLAIAVPLVTVLKLSEGATCPKVALQLQELRRSLGLVPAQEVQGWRTTVAGTPSEALLQHALAAAALKLQLPHLLPGGASGSGEGAAGGAGADPSRRKLRLHEVMACLSECVSCWQRGREA